MTASWQRPQFAIGARVRICRGVFSGFQGRIQSLEEVWGQPVAPADADKARIALVVAQNGETRRTPLVNLRSEP